MEIQDLLDGPRGIFNGAQIAGHGVELAAFLVEVLQGLSLLVVDHQPGPDRLGSVVIALGEFAAAQVTDPLRPGRLGLHVERRAAVGAYPATVHPLHDGLVRDFKRDHMVKLDPMCLQGFGLAMVRGTPSRI